MNTNLALVPSTHKAESGDRINPDPALMIRALRQVGYSFEQAIADLVDNSISAGAKNVLIRFELSGNAISRVMIVDDGRGMVAARLREAMKFGSEPDTGVRTLGKFGMGLKLASLSHCQNLTVLTRSEGRAGGRRWTVPGIERGWECDVLRADDAARSLDSAWAGLNLERGGTAVIWDDVDRLPTSTRGLRETLRGLQRRLQLHLGMCFHRFLESGRLRIILDQQSAGTGQQPHHVRIAPLNPFGYAKSGAVGYPKRFTLEFGGRRKMVAEAHIWPANSDSPQYSLGSKAASRQGFYFYRNDRLIQAGGWNGLIQHDSEPHGSLARVLVDVPVSFDADFGLNVQKSSVIAPSSFVPALQEAKTADGTTFDEFRRAAQTVYRKKDGRAVKERPLVPGLGFPRSAVSEGRRLLALDSKAVRAVDFIRGELADPRAIFEVDHGMSLVRLNHLLGEERRGPSRGTGADSAALRVCLFLLLREELGKCRLSDAGRKRVQEIDHLLRSILKPRHRAS